MRISLAIALLSSTIELSAAAQTPAAPAVLKAGSTACLTLKDAKNFKQYSTKAPEFAADLLARATCFVNQEDQPAIPQSKADGFEKLKLLSGHTVWLPATR